jgi:hypothetical protein
MEGHAPEGGKCYREKWGIGRGHSGVAGKVSDSVTFEQNPEEVGGRCTGVSM